VDYGLSNASPEEELRSMERQAVVYAYYLRDKHKNRKQD
jgi:hypothetical protein